MSGLSAAQRRRLNAFLGGRRCPVCRERHLSWASREEAVLCPVCGTFRSLTDMGIELVSTDRYSYWKAVR